MARQLWLLRHADAEPHGSAPDELRPLTERGRRQALIAGEALGRLAPRLDTVLVSPKVRATQTAEIAAHIAGEAMPPLRAHPPAASGYDAAQALADLEAAGADAHVLVVGHEPDLADVVGSLTGAAIDLKKGGLAVVRLGDEGAGQLLVLLRPAELALIAGQPAAAV
ncbi:MAG: SixA phosphatase family protein [Solirubrobacteraceae bacterium]